MMRKIFLLFVACVFASCLHEEISIPCVERVSVQWFFHGAREGEVSYSPSQEEQRLLQSWISDFARTAHVDYATYAPVLVMHGEEFSINISGNKIILNIKTEDGDSWTQISRDKKEGDEEMVDLVMKIITKANS